jgi:hypothetical protein
MESSELIDCSDWCSADRVCTEEEREGTSDCRSRHATTPGSSDDKLNTRISLFLSLSLSLSPSSCIQVTCTGTHVYCFVGPNDSTVGDVAIARESIAHGDEGGKVGLIRRRCIRWSSDSMTKAGGNEGRQFPEESIHEGVEEAGVGRVRVGRDEGGIRVAVEG